ncbi:hypothetical protein I4U23_000236 [Adineta vaga]|nr:hypothetical protein I4U23_000236 [Adineta vaga]
MVSVERVSDIATNPDDDDFLKPLDRRIDEYAYWEQQIDAVLCLLVKKKLMNLHNLRQGVESIEKSLYNKLTYYERWTISISKHCLESGLLTQNDLNEKYGSPLYSTNEQLFHVGDYVRVQHENYATRWIKPHLRTPGYLYGKIGVIERFCGVFPNPEYYAYENNDNKEHYQPLYRVRFNQKDIWNGYQGNSDDTIDVEIYQHWLLSASQTDLLKTEVITEENDHEHEHEHDDDHDHVHEDRNIIEQRAVDREGNPSSIQHLAESLINALLDKKILTLDELRRQIETIQMAGISLNGAELVVESWLNPKFKEELLKNSTQTIKQFLKLENFNTTMCIVENTDQIHNLIVCTLCSCYPRQLLGLPPGWYKSRSYRVRVPRNPREVLKEFGTELPDDMKIQIHDSTADLRYLVLPRRPKGTENWSREQLIPLVTRDAMIGVCDIKL